MPSRKSKVRQLAMQVLYLWDIHGSADVSMAEQSVAGSEETERTQREALALAQAAWEQRETADRWVERLAPQWPIHRQPPVDRNVLRLAVYELVNTTLDARIVIDQAIELAKQFSTEQSAAFVNAVLDSVLKEHRALTQAPPEV